MTSTFVKDALIVTQNSNREVFRGNILIEGDSIRYVGNKEFSANTVIDGKGYVAIPGLINTHAHVAMAHYKGMLDDMPLEEFLEKTFKYDSERTPDGIYNSAKLGMYEMIDSGITSFVDLYFSEDVIAKAAEDTDIRAFLSWNTLDEEMTTQAGSPLKNAENFIKQFGGRDLITPSIGVQGIYVASDETYLKALDIAEEYDTIIHTHLVETRKEVYDFVKKSGGERPIEHLDKIGFLNPRLLAAHSVWATLREVKMLKQNSVNVSWNAVSNSKLGVGGVAPVPEYMQNGVNVSLGTDSNGSNNSLNLFECMKFSSITVKNERWNAGIIKSQDILDMATINAAKSLRRNDLGSIEVGKKADLLLLDAKKPNLIPTGIENVVSNIVYSANPSNVEFVFINGKMVKERGRINGFNLGDFTDVSFN